MAERRRKKYAKILAEAGGIDRGARTPKGLFKELGAAGVKCDFREPNLIRAARTPLYNTFHEAWRFARIFSGDQ